MRRDFKDTMMELAPQDDRVVVVLGDISHFLFRDFQEKFPQRFFNMGICENTLISVGAGLSSQGFHPFIHTICPFLTERCVEQIKLDMAYNGFGGNIVTIGASFDYAWDGATHHSFTELAIFRMIPRMEVIQPGSARELKILIRSQYANGNPTYFRLSDSPHTVDLPDSEIRFGKAIILKDAGAKLTVMTAGPILGNVLEACRDLDVNLVYFHTIKPIDTEVIQRYRHTRIVVVHDAFGLHEAICTVAGLSVDYHGLPDAFCPFYGTVHDIRKMLGLDAASIRELLRGKLAA